MVFLEVDVDGTTRPTWRWSFPVADGLNSEVHDAEYLPDREEVLVVDMDRERVLTVDVETKAITWEWHASEQYDPPEDPLRTDWLHMNDVDRIGAGRYLVSVRNENQLLILERGEGVVDIINRDGDPETIRQQHNPQWLDDGAVLIADSENDRIVELHRNATTGNWSVAWALYSAGGIRFDWPRDADRLENGRTTILDTRNARLVEVDRRGTLLWSTSIPEQGYAAVRDGREYPAGDPYPAIGHVDRPVDQPLEPVSMLYGAVRHTTPLPRWFGEWRALAIVVGWVFIVAGLGLELIARQRVSTQEPIESTTSTP